MSGSCQSFAAGLALVGSAAAGTVLGTSTRGPSSEAVPIVVEASENIAQGFPGVPALQSFVSASWRGKWILIGGRTNGYHGSGGKDTDFERAQANKKIWVIDNTTESQQRVYSFPVSSLPNSLARVKDQWMSSNLLHYQDGDTLYIAGGYGENSHHEWVTYPILSAVSLPSLVDRVMNGRTPFADSISYVASPIVQSTGGNLLKLDDGYFYLAMGHIFMGRYADFEANNEGNQPKAWQKYLGEIRKLKIVQNSHHTLSVTQEGTFRNPEFMRRDLNVAYTVFPDGHTIGGVAYGGVFTKEQLNFSHPVYFGPGQVPWVDTSYEQKMGTYACATMLLYDSETRFMYTTFFGGISHWTWSYENQRFEEAPLAGDKSIDPYLDGMEWTDQISTLVRHGVDTFEFVQPFSRLPVHMGAEAVFFPAPNLRVVGSHPDILDLRQLRGQRTFVGYLCGGIQAFPKHFPYREDSPTYRPGTVPTRPSNMILKVYVTAPRLH